MFYLKKNPRWFSILFPGRVWNIKTSEKVLFLTFDDGPIPEVTDFVLDQLKQYNAKASFFCVGENVKNNPEQYLSIINAGHVVGNHTMHHLNASKTRDDIYLDDIQQCRQFIDSKLFRPPYGKLSKFLFDQLQSPLYNLKVIMWSVLSGDFDPSITPEKCLDNVLLRSTHGDIIVFHDSKKAEKNLRYALPLVLDFFTKKGFQFKALTADYLTPLNSPQP